MNIQALVPLQHTKPIGKYSAGIRVGVGDLASLVFISGQVAADDQGRTIGVGDPAAQAVAVFENLRVVLRAAGGDLNDLVSVTIYLTDMASFEAVSKVRNQVLGDPAPSSTLVEVSRLVVVDHLVEISGVAWIQSQKPIGQ